MVIHIGTEACLVTGPGEQALDAGGARDALFSGSVCVYKNIYGASKTLSGS